MKDFSCWCIILGIIIILIIHLILNEYSIIEKFGDKTIQDWYLSSLGDEIVRQQKITRSATTSTATIPVQGGGPIEDVQLGEDPIEPVQMGDDPLPSPVDCIGSWGNWTECSETCGGGEKTREYSITNPVENGGVECSREDGDTENLSCNTQGCLVNCVGSWGDWSECSKKYGNGRKFKEYTITTPAANGGQACPHTDHHVETTTCKENNLSGSLFKKIRQIAKNKSRWAIYTNKRNQADQRAGKNTPPNIFTNGTWIKPLNMTGQGRTVGTWRECRDRCINTPGCEYFNRFPNGGCHITDGKEGLKPGGGNPTSHSGKALIE